MRFSSIVLLSLVLLTSCGLGKKVIVPSVEVKKLGMNPEGILFLTVFFRQTEKGSEAYDLKAQWTDGKLKKMDVGEGDLVCRIIGSGEPMEIYFENPLFPGYEDYGEDGSIERVEVALPTAEYMFRINYDGSPRLIEIKDRHDQHIIGQFKI